LEPPRRFRAVGDNTDDAAVDDDDVASLSPAAAYQGSNEMKLKQHHV
jgi:hypothetical protein